jgi:SAM-dependent methyltransferase
LPYADGHFDLVVAMLTLHEMPPAIRAAVIDEMRRVLKPRGRLLLTDFHPGPLRFPRGYGVKPLILLIERMAGRDHFRNYRDFLAGGGLPPLIAGRNLQVVQQKIVSGGNLVLMLLKPSAASAADGQMPLTS